MIICILQWFIVFFDNLTLGHTNCTSIISYVPVVTVASFVCKLPTSLTSLLSSHAGLSCHPSAVWLVCCCLTQDSHVSRQLSDLFVVVSRRTLMSLVSCLTCLLLSHAGLSCQPSAVWLVCCCLTQDSHVTRQLSDLFVVVSRRTLMSLVSCLTCLLSSHPGLSCHSSADWLVCCRLTQDSHFTRQLTDLFVVVSPRTLVSLVSCLTCLLLSHPGLSCHSSAVWLVCCCLTQDSRVTRQLSDLFVVVSPRTLVSLVSWLTCLLLSHPGLSCHSSADWLVCCCLTQDSRVTRQLSDLFVVVSRRTLMSLVSWLTCLLSSHARLSCHSSADWLVCCRLTQDSHVTRQLTDSFVVVSRRTLMSLVSWLTCLLLSHAGLSCQPSAVWLVCCRLTQDSHVTRQLSDLFVVVSRRTLVSLVGWLTRLLLSHAGLSCHSSAVWLVCCCLTQDSHVTRQLSDLFVVVSRRTLMSAVSCLTCLLSSHAGLSCQPSAVWLVCCCLTQDSHVTRQLSDSFVVVSRRTLVSPVVCLTCLLLSHAGLSCHSSADWLVCCFLTQDSHVTRQLSDLCVNVSRRTLM